MNEQNYQYLEDSLKYMGFSPALNKDLKHHMQQNEPQFVLETQTHINGQKLQASLYFRHSEKTDRYFFNFYQARMNEDGLTNSVHGQIFYINRGHGVTLKEAYNLLEGRAVYRTLINREGEQHKAWLQLDFNEKHENGNYKMNQYHEGYGYLLAEELKKYPILEMEEDLSRERLIRSLEKGNLHTVNFVKAGQQQQLLIEAAPKYKSIQIYDDQMIRQWAADWKKTPDLEKEKEQNREHQKEKKKDQRLEKQSELPEEKKTRKRSKSRASSRP